MFHAANLPDLQAGVTEHYKKKLYVPLGYGHDANIEGRNGVIYIGLQLDGAQTGPRFTFRTAMSDGVEPIRTDVNQDAWWDLLHKDDLTKCAHGRSADRPATICSEGRPIMRRFEYLGPSYEGTC